jgi:hypothetical protein
MTTPTDEAKPPTAFESNRVRHLKRGSTYRVVGRGKVQTDAPLTDYDDVMIYQSEADASIWVRPVAEFYDGRFAQIDPAALPPCPFCGAQLVPVPYRKAGSTHDAMMHPVDYGRPCLLAGLSWHWNEQNRARWAMRAGVAE